MINIKSNAITVMYQIKRTGGPTREFTNTMATAAQRVC